jgi:hypothetical protein
MYVVPVTLKPSVAVAPELKTPALPIVKEPVEVVEDNDNMELLLTLNCNLFVPSSNNK